MALEVGFQPCLLVSRTRWCKSGDQGVDKSSNAVRSKMVWMKPFGKPKYQYRRLSRSAVRRPIDPIELRSILFLSSQGRTYDQRSKKQTILEKVLQQVTADPPAGQRGGGLKNKGGGCWVWL